MAECKVYFNIKHKGFSYVMQSGLEPRLIGVCLKVKDATWHATWVFIPTRDFMAEQVNPYRGFSFGHSRRVSVSNFCNGVHRKFQTGSVKAYLRSSAAPSEEVQE